MRIGLIGAGAVAMLHAKAAAALPDVTMSAVCDINVEAAQAVASEIGARAFTDYRDMLVSGAADAVIVNTPHSLHRSMTIDALKSGHHVLVEKPMAITLEDCDEMRLSSEAAGRTLAVGHIQHFLPEKAALGNAIREGRIGEVSLVHDQRSTDYRPGTRPAWFLDRATAGGGALMNIGAHCIDRSLWFAGTSPVEIHATTMSRFGVDVETDALLTIDLLEGRTASVCVTSDPPYRLDRVTVVGTIGVLTADPRMGTVFRNDGQSTVLHEPQPDDIETAFRAQLADFVASVEGAQPAVGLDHARVVVEVILAAYASERSGERVRVGSGAALAHGAAHS